MRGRIGIEGVRSDAGLSSGHVWFGLLTVLEIAAADTVEQRRGRQQDRGSRSLLRRLPDPAARPGRVELGDLLSGDL